MSRRLIGDPTETALVQLAHDGDRRGRAANFPRSRRSPFDSVRKRMSTIHGSDDVSGERRAVRRRRPQDRRSRSSKGPSTVSIDGASLGPDPDGGRRLDDEPRPSGCPRRTTSWPQAGRRVLGVGYRTFAVADRTDASRSCWTPSTIVAHDLGIVGIIDPPRTRCADAVSRDLPAAGVRPVMITGDHPLTAMADRHRARHRPDDRVLTGLRPRPNSPTRLRHRRPRPGVGVRTVSPEHKLRIVKSLQSQTAGRRDDR